jgi:hypothetical protein
VFTFEKIIGRGALIWLTFAAYRGPTWAVGGADDRQAHTHIRRMRAVPWGSLRRIRPSITLFTLLILFPVLASAQTPFDAGFTALQTLFNGTVAKVASLISIVVGDYQFAHGEPGAKKVASRAARGNPHRLLSGAVHQRQQVQTHPASGPPSATVG